jgi:phosphohistidine phosphatase
MELLLWRHAEAADGIPDAQRPLTPRGEKQARRVAKWLRKRLPEDTRILVSPATRCQQTAQALGLPFETVKRIGTAASVADVLAAAHWPKGPGQRGGTILVIGHQPTLGEVAARLLSGTEAGWQIKKGALWWLSEARGSSETGVVLRAVIGPELA